MLLCHQAANSGVICAILWFDSLGCFFVVLVAAEKREAKDKIQQSAARFQAWLSAQGLVSLTLFLVVFSRGTFTPHA